MNINIADEATNGFITAKEIKSRMKDSGLYPLGKPLYTVDTRTIEDMLMRSPFVQSAQCYKTQDGHVCITLTQRMPTLRIKSVNGDDYYLDDNNSIMPNSHYTSDLIIATGYISKWFARNYVAYVGEALMANDFWKTRSSKSIYCLTKALSSCRAWETRSSTSVSCPKPTDPTSASNW